MSELNLYQKVFNKLFEGLRTDNHDKFYNTESKREYAVNGLYPDIILTKKGTSEVAFIIEILSPNQGQVDLLINKIKPLTILGGVFYLLVPKDEKNKIEKICRENDIHPRFGIYQQRGNEIEILFE